VNPENCCGGWLDSPGAGMAGYRLYFLDDNGRIRDAAEFECDGDAEALSQAEARGDGRAMELWSGARVVAKIAKPAAE